MIRSFKIFILLVLLMTVTFAAAYAEPQITGQSGILIDTRGKILWSKNPHEKMYPASTTKILTALLVLENGNLDDTTVTSFNARNQIGSSLYLDEGETINIRDLLYGLMLRSGNDAAVVAAEYVSGSVEEFALLMNKRAVELGALNSNFVNPNGLHHEDHYSTAYDLAMIARYAMTIPEFREIVQTTTTTIPWPSEQWDRRLDNGNRLLTRYQGATGIKTGYTPNAGGTFVGSASRDGFELIAVTLQSSHTFDDAIAILDYGFDNFEQHLIFSDNQSIAKAAVRFGDRVQVNNIGEVYFTEKKDVSLDIKVSPNISDLEAPVKAGVMAGNVDISVNGESIASLPLMTVTETERKITTFWWFYAIVLVTIYIPIRLSIFLRRRRKKRRMIRKRSYYRQTWSRY
ncbi:MAG: D-alanyl-D-alanine carboxypeptidase family protein [Bacillota bacterium]|nr:D-alanyl-D-alanine carboxypeptidase family protein [Bacillota bacterium]